MPFGYDMDLESFVPPKRAQNKSKSPAVTRRMGLNKQTSEPAQTA
jgi:predicted RNase H-like nuclease (RuvC/YqgF family)